MAELRTLVLVLGDQLDLEAAAFDGFDPQQDAVWMAEVAEESEHVWSSKPRTALFLSAMRHFAQALQLAGRALHYTRLDDPGNAGSLAAQLQADIGRLRPAALVMTAPGDWRVLQALKRVAGATGLLLDVREDRHFFCTVREFAAHAKGRKQLRMEYFYREQRKRHGVLMQRGAAGAVSAEVATEVAREVATEVATEVAAGISTEMAAEAAHPAPADSSQPIGGQWNFDADNREAFGPQGPGAVPPRSRFEPDATTREVIALVNSRFATHPGRLDSFAWPVTRAQALHALQAFISERLPLFGRYQDAMWPGDPWLYHAHLSAALNLKLLNPREVVAAAEAAFHAGQVPLAAAEGFIRQVLGWREYVRGIYWTQMPAYAERNALGAQADLPAWYWTGDTDLACLRDALAQTLQHGYANHIQRLMVTGLFTLMLGVQPQQVHAWYLAVYVDAVEWVELPNTLGMSQYADGGVMASKPYAATGKYIQRMSPHCKGCRYDPAQRSGSSACPFTTLYWDFLLRHESLLARNPRMALQVKNLARLNAADRLAVTERAADIRGGRVGAAASATTTATAHQPAAACAATPGAPRHV